MRIVVCDDEEAEVKNICRMVGELCGERKIAAEVRGITGYKEFLEDAAKVRADIVLLDICMGKYNGVEAARILRQFNTSCAVIFVTSSPEYALEAFEVTASHYVLKPLTKEKLQEALERTRFFQKDRKCLHVNVDYAELRVPLDDILYMETIEHKTRLHLLNEDAVDTSLSLARISEQLVEEPQFFSCFRGILVNADYIEDLNENGVVLQGKKQLPVSLRRIREIRSCYHAYLIRKVRGSC